MRFRPRNIVTTAATAAAVASTKSFFFVSGCKFDFILALSHITEAENSIFLALHRRRRRCWPLNDISIRSDEMTMCWAQLCGWRSAF